jgi:hypothetical protein
MDPSTRKRSDRLSQFRQMATRRHTCVDDRLPVALRLPSPQAAWGATERDNPLTDFGEKDELRTFVALEFDP